VVAVEKTDGVRIVKHGVHGSFDFN